MKRVSVDIGGTFTDCFVVWDGRQIEAKALTTHHNLSQGFMAALEQAAGELGTSPASVLSESESVRYATTLGTNALIERRGPRLGLITTAGYEDVLLIGRGAQYGDGLPDVAQKDLPGADRPVPIIPRQLTVGIRERVDYAGDVILAPRADDVRTQVHQLVEQGARGFVVMLVNATTNPAHELLVAEVIEEEYPSAHLGSFPVVCSHQVSLKKGEYRRGMSAVLNAYLHREMQYALQSLEQNLRRNGFTKPMQIIHNSGGMSQMNRTFALQTVHAGPVAGLSAAEQASAELGVENLVCADMGGTSFDVGVVTGGGVRFYEFEPIIDRWRVDVPMVSMKAVGAGGGSIAKYDATFQGVRVGPESAGSEPGPACFGMGGREATVTDANLLLGYLNPDYYFEGRIKLDERLARRALARVGKPLGFSAEETAIAVREIVDNTMAEAMFNSVALKGFDPCDFTIFTYGGNGPTHACGFAEGLEVDRVLIPRNSAVFSAVGAGNMDQLHIHERSVYVSFYDAATTSLLSDFTSLNATIAELRDRGLNDLVRQGVPAGHARFRVELDMRYGDQLQLTTMVSPFERFDDQRQILEMVKRYHTSYGERFGAGTQTPEAGIKVNMIRVVAHAPHEKIAFAAGTDGGAATNGHGGSAAAEPKARRSCWFRSSGFVDTPIYDHTVLRPGAPVAGPAVVEAPHTTFVVHPQWTLSTRSDGFFDLTRAKES